MYLDLSYSLHDISECSPLLKISQVGEPDIVEFDMSIPLNEFLSAGVLPFIPKDLYQRNHDHERVADHCNGSVIFKYR